ncbi:hypothetical protein FRB93_011630 [Tulasnella sp. JGI-2019a]|nr:hypothetical protein FRB93_011630 [Tulasnella sp. JGI-2019a]
MAEIATTIDVNVPNVDHGLGLPTEKELELEIMLRERDEQIVRLVNDIKLLRRHLPSRAQSKVDADNDNDNDVSPDEPIVLPPSILNLIAPIIASTNSNATQQQSLTSGTSASGHVGTSATVTAALTVRLSALQEENDELYGLLTSGTIGRLHEEVRLLQHGTKKLEAALKESHTMIDSLKTELGEAYRVIEARRDDDRPSGRALTTKHPRPSSSPSGSQSSGYQNNARNIYAVQSQQYHGGSVSSVSAPAKAIPTGPRALKKQRLDTDDGPRERGGRRVEYSATKTSEGWTRTNDDDAASGTGGGLRINGAARRGNDNGGDPDSERGWNEPDDDRGSGGRGRTGAQSRSRSPAMRSYDARSQSPRDRDSGVPRGGASRSPSPLRMRSQTRSPVPRDERARSRSQSPPPHTRDRSRETARTPPLRRSRSPSRISREINHRNNNNRGQNSPRPMRRERERERPTGSSRPAMSTLQAEPSRPNSRSMRDRDRASAGPRDGRQRNGGSGSAASSKPTVTGQGQAQPAGGSLISRIK